MAGRGGGGGNGGCGSEGQDEGAGRPNADVRRPKRRAGRDGEPRSGEGARSGRTGMGRRVWER